MRVHICIFPRMIPIGRNRSNDKHMCATRIYIYSACTRVRCALHSVLTDNVTHRILKLHWFEVG